MIRLVNILVGAVIGFTAALGLSGRTADLFSEVGQCRLGLERDGTFYQSDRHTENFMHPGCLSLGIQDKWKDSKFGWRASFLATGQIQARGNMAVNDETRGATTPCDRSVSEANCQVKFDGSGSTFGFTLGATFEQPLFAHAALIGESGLFFFQHHFKAEAKFENCCGREISGYNETSRLWDMPSPFLGLTLRYRSVYVAARHFWPSGHRALSLTNHEMNQFVVGLVKPL